MGVWDRLDEEHVADFQPPPCSEHWHYDDNLSILAAKDEKKEPGFLGDEPGSPHHTSEFLADMKVSPYYDSELRQGRPTISQKEESPLPSQRRLHNDDNSHCLHHCKSFWLRSLKKKHHGKHNKSSSSSSSASTTTTTTTATPIPTAPKFTAIPIPVKAPQIHNKITLSQPTIPLYDPSGHSYFDPSPFKITLETTLLEKRPYTICSTVLQRNQSLNSLLSHFEVVDLETGYVLSEKPLPPPHQAIDTRRKHRRPKPSSSSSSSSFSSSSSSSSAAGAQSISKSTCTQLHPQLTSVLTIMAHPSASKSSTERLFDGLRIAADPTLLLGRRLMIRLRPSVALWSARTMEALFGFGDVVAAWPDAYGRPLVLRGEEEEGEEDERYGGGVGVEFSVVEGQGRGGGRR